MPVRAVTAGECPLNIGPAKAVSDVCVLDDVSQVIETDELVVDYRPIDPEGDCGQQEHNQCREPMSGFAGRF